MSYSVKLNNAGIAERVVDEEVTDEPVLQTARLTRRPTPRTFTKAGAIRLANMIARYWRDRGATTVKLRVERDHSIQEIELWTVRSNLVGGLSPKA